MVHVFLLSTQEAEVEAEAGGWISENLRLAWCT